MSATIITNNYFLTMPPPARSRTINPSNMPSCIYGRYFVFRLVVQSWIWRMELRRLIPQPPQPPMLGELVRMNATLKICMQLVKLLPDLKTRYIIMVVKMTIGTTPCLHSGMNDKQNSKHSPLLLMLHHRFLHHLSRPIWRLRHCIPSP